MIKRVHKKDLADFASANEALGRCMTFLMLLGFPLLLLVSILYSGLENHTVAEVKQAFCDNIAVTFLPWIKD